MSLLGACGRGAAEPPKDVFDFGATYEPPVGDPVVTGQWGWVAPDQIAVLLADGESLQTAKNAAEVVGGKIDGGVEYINLYVVRIPATDGKGIEAAMGKAAAAKGVAGVMPNQLATADIEVVGVECSVIGDDPVYAGANARPYEMIGVENAWKVIRAAGIPLGDVTVGVADGGLYRGQGEFGGDTKVESSLPDEEAAAPDEEGGKPMAMGTHGTAVTGIIAADAGNGGQTGIASVLGSKLKVVHTNVFGRRYGSDSLVLAPKADDPTWYRKNGQTYSIGDLQALTHQIEQGATVINCSWGNSNAHPVIAALYRNFFEKMARDHPKVLFVCSAGNDGLALDGSRRYPSGASLPNVITVGCVDNDGSKVEYSNEAGDDFEVTLAAPGHRVVAGVGADGAVSNINGGTSFATPQVTAAAAMMRALNPNLSAGDIKEILSDTATSEFTAPDGKVTQVPEGLGAGVVNIQAAVLEVVNGMREKKGKSELTMEEVEGLSAVKLSASSENGSDWDVTAAIGSVAEKGADLKITLNGEGAIGGKSSRHLGTAGSAKWSVTPKDSGTVHVKRSDTGACSRVALAGAAGTYAGTFAMPIEVEGGGTTTQDVPLEIVIEPDNTVAVAGSFKGPVRLPGASGGTLDIETSLQLAGGLDKTTVNTTGTWKIHSIIKAAGLTIDAGTQSVKATLNGTVNAGLFTGMLDIDGTKVEVVAKRKG